MDDNTLNLIIMIINILAISFSPVIAVLIGRWLENRSEHRKDKMEIFKTLMTARGFVKEVGWTAEAVKALNIIDIVFADDKKVREAWKNLYDKYCVSNLSAAELKKLETLTYKLLESIAVSLGYKDKITWETIQSAYLPKGMSEQINSKMQTQQLFSTMLASMVNNPNNGDAKK